MLWRSRTQGPAITVMPIPMSSKIQGEGVFVLSTLAVAFAVMAGDWAPPEIVFTLVNGLYNAAGITTDAQAASGYGNTGLLTVVFLYMVAEGIYQTGLLEGAMIHVLGKSRSPFWAIVRVCIPVLFIAAFLNNTPIVALMTPILIAWSRRSGVPVKKVLIPMAFSATLGGTCTLIGTSTNLIIAGQQASRYKGSEPFGIFDIAPYGVPYAIWGFLFMCLTQSILLPGNSSKHAKELLMALKVTKRSAVHGKILLDSGLLDMVDTVLMGCTRADQGWIQPLSPKSVIQEGDVLYVIGELTNTKFYAEEFGLIWLDHKAEDVHSLNSMELGRNSAIGLHSEGGTRHYDRLIQVTVGPASNIIGKDIRDVGFRELYGSTVVAFARPDMDCYNNSISDMTVKAGDVLILNVDEEMDISGMDFSSSFVRIISIQDDDNSKRFITSFTVVESSSLVGRTMRESGFQGMQGLTAFAVDSPNDSAGLVEEEHENLPSDYLIREGDIIWFAADLLGYQFLRKLGGISQSVQGQVQATLVKTIDRELTQAVISSGSYLAGKTLKQSAFRQRFSAAVVGISRVGRIKRLPLSEIILQEGDVLLVESKSGFSKDKGSDSAFSLLQPVSNSSPPKKDKGWIAVTLGAAMVMTQVINGLMSSDSNYTSFIKSHLYRNDLINLWPASVLTTVLMIATRCLTCKQATDSIQWSVYLTVAAAFGVSVATESSGVAKAIADLFVSISKNIGGDGSALTAIYLATAIISEILTNNAAGAVMYPIAAEVADQLGISANAITIAVMLGASAAWVNPYGYQCNLMVYNAGGYSFKEFAMMGVPFQIYLAVVAAFILCFMDQWQSVWIVTFSAATCVLGGAAGWAALPRRTTLSIELWIDASFRKTIAARIKYVAFLFKRRSHSASVNETNPITMRS